MRHSDKIAGIKVNSRLAVRARGKPGTALRSPASFDRRYDALEHKRARLLDRLSSLNDKARGWAASFTPRLA